MFDIPASIKYNSSMVYTCRNNRQWFFVKKYTTLADGKIYPFYFACKDEHEKRTKWHQMIISEVPEGYEIWQGPNSQIPCLRKIKATT